MWIVALAWIYVVGLMALTEPSVVAGVMTLLTYCLLPLCILFYITGSKRRQARRNRAQQQAADSATAHEADRNPGADADADKGRERP